MKPPKKRTLKSQSPFDDSAWPASDEEVLAVILIVAQQQFEADPNNPLPAFDVLTQTVSYRERKRGLDPQSLCIPSWAVEAIAERFADYVQSAKDGLTTSFGETMGIEGGGQGKPRKIHQYLKQLRDHRIAMGIALDIERGAKTKVAVSNAAESNGLSYSAVNDIWSTQGKKAGDLIFKLQTRKRASDKGPKSSFTS